MKLEEVYDKLSNFKLSLKSFEAEFEGLRRAFSKIGVEISCDELSEIKSKILIWKTELFKKEYAELLKDKNTSEDTIHELKLMIDELEEEIQR